MRCSPAHLRTVTVTSFPERPCTRRVCALTRHSIPSSLRIRCISAETSGSSWLRSCDACWMIVTRLPKRRYAWAKFETDIAAAEDDEMWRHVVELQRFDIGERARGLKAGNIGDRRMCADVEEDLVAGQHACAAIIEVHFERFRSHETPGPHDELGAAVLVVAQVRGNLG